MLVGISTFERNFFLSFNANFLAIASCFQLDIGPCLAELSLFAPYLSTHGPTRCSLLVLARTLCGVSMCT